MIPGQFGSKHSRAIVAGPVQPNRELFKQCRVLIWIPLEQETLQVLQSDHGE